MQWLSKDSLDHPMRQWRPVPFAFLPIRFGDKWYWLEQPPFEYCKKVFHSYSYMNGRNYKFYRHKDQREYQDRDPGGYDWENGVQDRRRLRY